MTNLFVTVTDIDNAFSRKYEIIYCIQIRNSIHLYQLEYTFFFL